jgi:hypothetical protein
MKVKCVSNRLNHITYDVDGNGKKTPRKVLPGMTFNVKNIPKAWEGLVVPLEGDLEGTTSDADEKTAVVNPADNDDAAKAAEAKAAEAKASEEAKAAEEAKAKAAKK